jgi:hypothetical protein
MADTWIQGSFVFRCTDLELALIEEAFEASYQLTDADIATPPPSANFAAHFRPTDQDDPWSGFRAVFSDPGFVTFGAALSTQAATSEDTMLSTLWLHGITDFQPEPIARLIHRVCQRTLANAPIAFEWCATCFRPDVGEFGGGWRVIFPDRIAMESSGEAVRRVLAGDMP